VIAALYVEGPPRGVYCGLHGVDPWYLPDRDAREYAGPWPVVAHPPCQRWGRYWYGGPSAKVRLVRGDDGGCFAAALASVRRWGGVLEHPADSSAWAAHGLIGPRRGAGWVTAGDFLGWTCCVEQGHYGHRARKATWLYAVRCDLPELDWGPSTASVRLDAGCPSKEERRRIQRLGDLRSPRLHRRECAATPPAFRDVLIAMARSSVKEAAP
jgi:hypothetical protein